MISLHAEVRGVLVKISVRALSAGSGKVSGVLPG
jgi:hypothetical protein